jgi:hypothetical protein
MSVFSLIFAMLATFLPAWMLLNRVVPLEAPSRRYITAGYSVILGMLITTLVIRMLSSVGLSITLYSVSASALLLLIALRYFPQPRQSRPTSVLSHKSLLLTRTQKFFVLVCLALLASRLIAIGLEAYTRPVWAWDAKQHWTKQARVFFELRSLVPYVSLQQWLDLGGRGVYTNMHPDYPIATPLLQAWTATALGYWHSSLVNLFWPIMWLGLGLVFFSQARIASASLPVAIAATYMLLSMPLLNIHAALAGYADLLMAACYLGAVAAFYNWSRSRAAWQLLLSLFAGVGCLLIKNEGIYWLMTLLPGILLVTFGLRRGLALLALGGIIVLILIMLLPSDQLISGHSISSLDISYRPESWRPIFLSALVHDNWHFLIYLFIPALLVVPLYAREQIPLAAVVASAIALYMVLYLLTSNAAGAVRFTSLNRVALQLAPAIGFLSLTVYLELSKRQGNRAPKV